MRRLQSVNVSLVESWGASVSNDEEAEDDNAEKDSS
jgi:hypothetical protein